MSTPFAFGPFSLDTQRGMLLREGRHVAVSSRGLRLLQTLLCSAGRVLTKTELMQAAWDHAAVEESNLSVQIAALRKQLGPTPDGGDWIATIPRVGYRFVELPAQAASEDGESSRTLSAERQHRPSIAVLPFANLSSEDEQEYLVDGITEDIVTALTRFRWFFVIARNSSFAYKGKTLDAKQIAQELGVRYLLEGSVRKSDQRIRISAQLVEAASANHIWAERYDLELTEVFAVQDEIAERVAGAIEPELLKSEGVQAAARHTGNMTAWDLVRRGTWHFHQVTRDNHLKARELFRQARKLDPELPEAHIWLARVSAGVVAYGWSDKPEMDIREGLDAALKAIQFDEKNPYSHYALAICSPYANAPEQAVLAAEKAIEISPSFALGHLVLGMSQLFRGSAREAIPPFERGLTLNPYDPQNFVWYNLLALAHLFADQGDKALAAAVKARKIRPAWRPLYGTLACCFAALSRLQEAEQCIEQMRQLEEPSGDALGPLRLRNPHWTHELANLLKKAGWQEKNSGSLAQ